MATDVIAPQSVTVQLPASHQVQKLKDLLQTALKVDFTTFDIYHNGQQLPPESTLQNNGIGQDGFVLLKLILPPDGGRRLEILEFSIVVDANLDNNKNSSTSDGSTQTSCSNDRTPSSKRNNSRASPRHNEPLGNGPPPLKKPKPPPPVNTSVASTPSGPPSFTITSTAIVQGFLRTCSTDYGMGTDPKTWPPAHVGHFIEYIFKQLHMPGIAGSQLNVNGLEFINLSKSTLLEHFPLQIAEIIFMHIETLKLATTQELPQLQPISTTAGLESLVANINSGVAAGHPFPVLAGLPQPGSVMGTQGISVLSPGQGSAYKPKDRKTDGGEMKSPQSIQTRAGSSSNGQIQLWQFLLELLTDKSSRHLISWVGDKGAFKLADPEKVAQLWGDRKNKPAMNYEKLSRALRYYYDGDMIHKVHGKRFVYQFVYDLKLLLGYSAAELSQLVNEPVSNNEGQSIVIGNGGAM